MLEPWALKHKRLKKKLAWWLYQQRDLQAASLLHATSMEERQQFGKLGLRTRAVMIPNGVDAAPAGLTQALPPRSVLFLSRIHPKKGLELLVRAVAGSALFWRNEGWRLYIVGPGSPEYVAFVERMIVDAGIADFVEMREAVDGTEKWSLLSSAELVVLPTYSENFGLVVAEALSAGTPVVTTTGTPWSELQEQQCGWWVPLEEGSLTAAMREALSLTTEERKRMGERGRDLMSQRYSWPAIAAQMLEAYRDVTQGARPT
jgi:glycosyltransferase involved in cell wall biosynthesis